ncbi:MAG: GHMP kinase [Bacillota bacterium]
MKATVRAPGTCGELVQGVNQLGDFQITCPIAQYSEVTVELTSEIKEHLYQPSLSKTAEIVSKTLDYLELNNLRAIIQVKSQLPRAKGLGSSTADLTAAAQATALAAGEELSADEIADLAISVEPTDGLFYNGLVLFNHLSGIKYRSLGSAPEIDILVLDLGSEVDTVEFNSNPNLLRSKQQNRSLTNQALRLVSKGIAKQAPELIGAGATLSSWANQSILPKDYFTELLSVISLSGVWGINTAHSGTVMGILYDSEQIRTAELKNNLSANIRANVLTATKLMDGGLEVVASDS